MRGLDSRGVSASGARAVGWFLEFCEREDVEFHRVTLGLAGLRHFFDTLVTRHAVVLNPFHSGRGIQHQVLDGKTPEIS